MTKHDRLLFVCFLHSFLLRIRRSIVPLVCGMLLLFSADCSLTMGDLQYSNPRAEVVYICDKPLDVPDDVNLWGFDFETGRLVTGEDPLELRLFDSATAFFEYDPDAPVSSALKMPPEYGLTCVKPMSFSHTSARFLPPSSELLRSKEPCAAKVAETGDRLDPRFMANPPAGKTGKPPVQAMKKPQALVRVCARPAGVGEDVNKWASRDVKGKLLTNSDKVFAEAVAKAEIIFIFDKTAPPESVYWFVKDPAKLRCPDKPPPQPYDQATASGRLAMMALVTSIGVECAVDPKKGDGQTSWTSSADGEGKPLNLVEVLARNLSIAGALASGDTSGNQKDPNGKRYGMLGGKSADGPDWLVLQAAAGTFAIIGLPLKSGKEFIAKVTTALSEKKVASIVDPKVLTKEIAEQLAHEPEQAAVDKAIAALKQGNTKPFDALESFGKAMAPSLREAGVILPYSRAKIFTKGWEGKFQAHHALEVDMGQKVFGMDMKAIDDIPAIILSEAKHKEITKALNDVRAQVLKGTGRDTPKPDELWKIYQEAYKDYPAWLDAIKGYFAK